MEGLKEVVFHTPLDMVGEDGYRRTYGFIGEEVDGYFHLYIGTSKCHPKDQFIRKVGRHKAIGRAHQARKHWRGDSLAGGVSLSVMTYHGNSVGEGLGRSLHLVLGMRVIITGQSLAVSDDIDDIGVTHFGVGKLLINLLKREFPSLNVEVLEGCFINLANAGRFDGS